MIWEVSGWLRSCKCTFYGHLSRIRKLTRFIRKVFATKILLSRKFSLFVTLMIVYHQGHNFNLIGSETNCNLLQNCWGWGERKEKVLQLTAKSISQIQQVRFMDRKLPGRTQTRKAPAILKAPGTVANGPDLGSRCLKLTSDLYQCVKGWEGEARQRLVEEQFLSNGLGIFVVAFIALVSSCSVHQQQLFLSICLQVGKNTKIIVYKSGKKYKNICLQIGPTIPKSLSHLWKISIAIVSFRIIQMNLQAIFINTICILDSKISWHENCWVNYPTQMSNHIRIVVSFYF